MVRASRISSYGYTGEVWRARKFFFALINSSALYEAMLLKVFVLLVLLCNLCFALLLMMASLEDFETLLHSKLEPIRKRGLPLIYQKFALIMASLILDVMGLTGISLMRNLNLSHLMHSKKS